MKKKFITNLALVLSLNLLVKPIWIFVILIAVQNRVGVGEFGVYQPLFNLTFILSVFLDLGIRNFNNRDIAQHNQLLSKYLSNIFGLKILLAVIYLIIILIIGYLVDYNERQMKLLIILAFNQFISGFILYLRSNISALHYFKTDSIMSVLDRFLMIVFCGVLLWGGILKSTFTIELFAYAQTVAYILTFLTAFLIVLSKSEFFKIRFDRNYIIALVKRIYPFGLLALLMGLYTYIDSIMLERMLPDGNFQAGIYAQGFVILSALSMFGFLYAGLLLPMFAKMIKNKEPVGQLTQLSSLLLIVPASLLVISSVFYSNDIINLLYPGHTNESPVVFAILMPGFVAMSTTYIFGTLLTANGNLKALNIMAALGMILNIVLNIILIPKYKAIGSASASIITQGLTALAQVIIAIKIFKFNVRIKLIFSYLLFFAGVIGFGVITMYLNFNWYYKFAAMFIFSGTFAILIKLIDLKVIYQILRYGDS